MKALVLAGGRGSRLHGVTNNGNKCMLRVGGVPLIEFSLNNALSVDVSEIVVVVGYMAEAVINAYGTDYRGKRIRYVIQKEQKGLVHAIECASEALDGEDFMLMLGDEAFMNARHREMASVFDREGLFGICGVVKVEERSLISRTYAIIQGPDDRIFRLIEKPRNPLNSLMGTGNCIFRNEILSYIDETPINQKRGEKELPDLIQCAIDDGRPVRSFDICDRYVNVNSEMELDRALSFFSHV